MKIFFFFKKKNLKNEQKFQKNFMKKQLMRKNHI